MIAADYYLCLYYIGCCQLYIFAPKQLLLIIRSDKQCCFHSACSGSHHYILHIYNNGHVFFSNRLLLTG